MKTLFYILVYLLISLNLYSSDCICFYAPIDLDKNICRKFIYLMEKYNIFCDMREIKKKEVLTANSSIVYIAGMGHYNGIFLSFDYDNLSDDNLILYRDLALLPVDILIIDACYAGYIFDYPSNIPLIITSTYKENSWNIINKEGLNISSFIEAWLCILDDNYKCKTYYCKDNKLKECQLNIIIEAIQNEWKNFRGGFVYWEYPSVGVMTTNKDIYIHSGGR